MSRVIIFSRSLVTVDGQQVRVELGRSSDLVAPYYIEIGEADAWDFPEITASSLSFAARRAVSTLNLAAARQQDAPSIVVFRFEDLALTTFGSIADDVDGLELSYEGHCYRFSGDQLQMLFDALFRLGSEIRSMRRAAKLQRLPAGSIEDPWWREVPLHPWYR